MKQCSPKPLSDIFYVQFKQRKDTDEKFFHFHLKLAEYEAKTVFWLFEPFNEKIHCTNHVQKNSDFGHRMALYNPFLTTPCRKSRFRGQLREVQVVQISRQRRAI